MPGPAVFGPIVGFCLLLGFAVWRWSRRTKARRLARIRAEWGCRRDRRRDFEAIADLFQSREAAADTSLDDHTWKDLLLDDVFAEVDRAESVIGQQVLYCRLRSAPAPRALAAFEVLVSRVTLDPRIREDAQVVLAGLTDPSAYYLHRLARPDALNSRWWHVLFPLWTGVVVLILALAFVWPTLLVVGIAALLGNLAIRIRTGNRVGGEIAWFRQVGPLIHAASTLATVFDTVETTAITGTFKIDLPRLQRLGSIARWVSRDAAATGELAAAVLEYLNLALLMDVNALYFANRELRLHAPALRRIIEAVGEIDSAIAVASYRAGGPGWARPSFVDAHDPFVAIGLRHPLVVNAVPNTIALAPPRGLLITGSNMSGKSTLLRTVGVNAVMAQTIATTLATSYTAPIFHVRSCINYTDDVIAGKSYYLVEVESVLSIVTASRQEEPQLFICDELFRGTNAVERVAAAEAVLREVVGGGRPHVVLAATHDAELVGLLEDCYAVCHLGDAIGPNGLVFDYRVEPGPATSRNAIALLELSGAPSSLVSRALARAASLDRDRALNGKTPF